ncbi:glycoside hydrolase superfamily [Dipodascopsis uninucleata]
MVNSGFLKVSGTKIVDSQGNPVVLVGTATGGHLNMENFITGYPGHETEHKEPLLKVLGKEKFDFFFDKFYEYFWTDKDSEFLASLNLNCLRIPFNYRHFLDDSDLKTVKQSGFKYLDRMIESCAKYGVYTILDLHAVPGGQNQDWHSDSGIHKALFWQFQEFQDRIVDLWKVIAAHYKDNTWVAGYNPLNEPGDSKNYRLINFYTNVERAIRDVDPNHILFLDGNTYAMDFSQFPSEPYPNTVYAIHDYSNFGFPGSGTYVGSEEQVSKLKRQYERKIEYMKKIGVPVWNGEFGPVYSAETRGDTNIEATNSARYKVLRDQLSIYKTGDPSGDGSPISWSIWVYKDIGYQGLTYVSPDSKWFKVLGEFLLKKKKLGLDKWGRDADPKIENLYIQISSHFKEAISEKFHRAVYPYIWGIDGYANRVLRDMLFSQFMSYEFAECFRDLTFEDLDEMAASFKFENVIKREELNNYLSEYFK